MKLMNKMLYSVFVAQLLLIAVFASISLLWMQENMEVLTYLNLGGGVGPLRWGEQFLTYWVAYSHMIPISLYVIIEMLKLLLREIINRDVKMFFVEDMQFA